MEEFAPAKFRCRLEKPGEYLKVSYYSPGLVAPIMSFRARVERESHTD